MKNTMNTIPTTLESFKRLVASFCKKAAECDSLESLDAGFKTVSLGYLGLQSDSSADALISQSYLEYASNRYAENEVRLLQK